ncbi:MAG: UvrD-helicase domain-containing protein [Flavobacteriales bacterium]
MSNKPQLIIHDASAGSGKTFTLVKNYMEICLNPEHPIDIYTKILAITFTNKAAKEMKDRIIDQLEDFARPTSKMLFLLDEFSLKFQVDIPSLKKRAFLVLQHILHNFGQFSVSTIDKFMLKIVRSIQYEIGLNDAFELIMDYDEWFEESVAEVIDEVEKDKEVEQFLFNYLKDKINDDKSWNLESDIIEIAHVILREDYVKHISSVIKLNGFEDIKQIEGKIEKKQKELNDILSLVHEEYREILNTTKVVKSDFSRGNCALFNVFSETDINMVKKKLSQTKITSLANKLNKLSFFAKKNLSQPHIEQAQAMFEQFVDKYKDAIFKVIFHSTLLGVLEKQVQNLYFEYLLNDKLNAYLEKNQYLPIGALNGILDEYVQNDEIPMLLMKMGERFEYIFIDEFQDTSDTQWSNLYPFIENILSKGYQVHLIGDAKQSIYRFRGGDVEILLDLKKNRHRSFYEIIDAPALNSNWRSGRNIVEFNNQLFSDFIQDDLNKATFKDIYKVASQQVQVKRDSYVEILSQSTTKENKEDVELLVLKNKIEDVCSRGFALGDISILCRNSKEIRQIADFLLQEDIPFVNDESLLVFSDKQVQFLWDVLVFQIEGDNLMLKSKILGFLYREIIKKHDGFSAWFIENEGLAIVDIMEKEGLSFPKQIEQNFYEFLEQIVHLLQLKKNTYILQFLELCHKQISRGQTQIHQFIKLGEIQKEKWKIQLPDNDGALKILTVHKSKGLEYPVVFLPFLDKWDVFNSRDKQWYPTENVIEDIPFVKTSFGDELLNEMPEDLVGFIKEIKEDYKANMYFDFINMFYVACTRASRELYLLNATVEVKTKKTTVEKKNLSEFIVEYFKPQSISDHNFTVSFGDKVTVDADSKSIDRNYLDIELKDSFGEQSWTNNIKIAQHEDFQWIFEEQISAQQRGNHIHNILAEIEHDHQMESALKSYFSKRWIPKKEMDLWKNQIEEILQHPKVSPYFESNVHVWNERDWFGINGETIRPDRVVSLNKKELIIIDYKTGKPDASHKRQVDEYERQLSFSENYTVVKKILIYTENIDVVEVD